MTTLLMLVVILVIKKRSKMRMNRKNRSRQAKKKTRMMCLSLRKKFSHHLKRGKGQKRQEAVLKIKFWLCSARNPYFDNLININKL